MMRSEVTTTMRKSSKKESAFTLADEVIRQSSFNGLELQSLEVCKSEGTVYHCPDEDQVKSTGDKSEYSVIYYLYNPNVEAIDSFNLRMSRSKSRNLVINEFQGDYLQSLSFDVMCKVALY